MQKTNPNSGLAGKKIILLGGSSGLGLATAKAAAAEGADILICSGSQQRVDQALSELPKGTNGQVVDLSQELNIEKFFSTTGSFDHLVYTAGENLNLTTIADAEIAKAKSAFTIRYWGAYAAIKYGTPNIQPGGSINLISGTANARPGCGWSVASSISLSHLSISSHCRHRYE
jgi:NAD(P)-dependent dehydrogenase (short-subunit alcohol dehydrogenase family)